MTYASSTANSGAVRPLSVRTASSSSEGNASSARSGAPDRSSSLIIRRCTGSSEAAWAWALFSARAWS
ncbi:hypothetical protein V2I01_06215 [Micromonospora sp. BRA006-A]|nr:hypothetical protein [Micromonospora sp. BRA006-A]